MDYENSQDGRVLQQYDLDKAVRQKIRLKNLDSLNNGVYNLVNGANRLVSEIPPHLRYNPPDNPITGVQQIGTKEGYAGRPIRGLEK
jgi:hypothetical protein